MDEEEDEAKEDGKRIEGVVDSEIGEKGLEARSSELEVEAGEREEGNDRRRCLDHGA